MEIQSQKPFLLGKFKRIIGFLWFVFALVTLIARFITGGREFCRDTYIDNITVGLCILSLILQITHDLIYDKEETTKRLKNLLLPMAFGVLLIAIWYYSRRN